MNDLLGDWKKENYLQRGLIEQRLLLLCYWKMILALALSHQVDFRVDHAEARCHPFLFGLCGEWIRSVSWLWCSFAHVSVLLIPHWGTAARTSLYFMAWRFEWTAETPQIEQVTRATASTFSEWGSADGSRTMWSVRRRGYRLGKWC